MIDKGKRKYWEVFGVSLLDGKKSEVLEILQNYLAKKEKRKWIATVNPEFAMEALRDKNFAEILRKTDLNVMDGIGLVWAFELDHRLSILDRRSILKKNFLGIKIAIEILKGKYKNRVAAGSDLVNDLCKIAAEKKYKVFFLGGFNDSGKKAKKFFKEKYDGLVIENFEGRPNFSNEEVIKEINKFKPDILFVAYGMKKQEIWINENLKNLDVGIVMGVGRSFDYYSGNLKRAPDRWKKMGLEWLYSLIQEPKRFKRQLSLPKFVWKVLMG